MKVEAKVKWIEALRSGKYEQVPGTLRQVTVDGHESFCCLGVLCEISGLSKVLFTKYDQENITRYGYNEIYSTSNLPDPFRVELGLDMDIENKLTDMNDNCGKSFKDIADWIEENL